MRLSDGFGLYGILTRPAVGYERLTEIMVANGEPLIQLRLKGTPRREVADLACRLRRLVPAPCRFIVNDDVEVARDSGADGVHLGQEDEGYASAREKLGPEAIIGLSTHTVPQTLAACALQPDYIGVGPVFATPTKAKPDPVIGLDGMRAMLAVASVPAVAIGGIDGSNAAAVLQAGARNLCAVRFINAAADPDARIKALLRTLRDAGPRPPQG